MKCPDCGEELKEGYLYCENCGADIHIVPDYEPELELSLKQSVEEIFNQVEQEQRLEQERKEARKRKIMQSIKVCGIFGVLVLIAVLGMFVSGIVRQLNYNSYDYQLEQAHACMAKEAGEEALAFYERALELQPTECGVRLELAELYYAQGSETAYMEQLRMIVEADYAGEVDKAKAYEKMIAFYEEKAAYEAICQLLEECFIQQVLDANQKYLPESPEFSYEEGTYSEIIPLKITANSSGTIYYTTDGSLPDTGSTVYTSPIFLETGTHVISALFVNDYGIAGEVTTKEYTIGEQKPPEPEVSVYSGSFDKATMIQVEVPEEGRVFYTTDGSYPTDQSLEYSMPIPMPLGKSWFKFVSYNAEGVASEVTVREFELSIQDGVSVEAACQAVIDLMMASGKIYNSLGESYQVEGKYLYILQYPLAVEGSGDYYIITEFYEEPSGVRMETGSEFAVNIYDETVYKFTINNGNYLLEGF